MSKRVAVIGAGMTKCMRRAKETGIEMCAKAVEMALKDANMTIDDIDAVVMGTAPDAFDGVHMKGEYLLSGSGAKNKPYLRYYVGGGTGVFMPIAGYMHIASGKFRTCLVVAEEKMSPCHPHPQGAFLTIFDHTTEQPLKITLIHIFGMEMARFMHIYGYTERDLALVSVLCKKNALAHPAAQIAQMITVDDVLSSPVLSWPVKRLDISPTSDAAVALVLCNEDVARSKSKGPVFIDGIGFRLDTAYWCTRDLAYPEYVAMAARDAYKMAGVSDPLKDIDIFEPYDPFDYKALHHMNGLLLDRSGRRVKELLFSGAFERDGSHPMCPSGGLLGVGNPIAAAGLMKVAELYFQLSGQAGERQVKKEVHRGVAQAWGDLMQVGTVVVMSSEGRASYFKSMWMETKELPGTPLQSVKDTENICFSPDLRYSWDNGVALTTYLEGFKKGKIRGSKCAKCGRIMVPARAFCELCNLREVSEWYDLSDTGTVMTYTISHIDWDSKRLPDGQTKIFAVIAIDGASPEQGMLHTLGEVKPEDVHIGMRVKAVFKEPDQRKGCVTDILYFRPLKPEEDKSDKTPVRIKPEEINTITARSFPGVIPLSYIYTAGLGGSCFYRGITQGKILGAKCRRCDQVFVPPSSFCEDCMCSIDLEKDIVEVGNGSIEYISRVWEDHSGHPLDKPIYIISVVFPDAKGRILGRYIGTDEPELCQTVRLVRQEKVDCPDCIMFEAD